MTRLMLKEVCDVFDGPHATPTKTEEGPIYLGINAITEDGRLNEKEFVHLSTEDYDKWTKRVVPKENDIVFSYEATLGRYAIIPKGFYGCLGRRLAIIRNKSDTINTKWLFYYFFSPEWKALIRRNTVKGSTVDRISVEEFPMYTIPAVQKKEQDKIASILSTIDEKINTNNRINDNLQHQLRLMYDYWFTQFDFPDINGNPYKSSGGLMTWNGQLNQEIPYGWRVGTVGDCVARIATGLNPRDNFTLGQGSIKYLTVKNLTTSGAIDFSNCDTVNESARRIIHRRSDVHTGDILFASIAPLGRCHLIQEEPKGWDINESIFSIRPNLAITSAELLYAYFTSESFVKGATYSSTGSVFKGIRINTLLDSQMLIPPLNISLAFSDGVRRLLLQTNSNMNESEHLTKLRDWLLPMLMNGQAIISD